MKIKQLEWKKSYAGSERATSLFGVFIAGPGGSWPPGEPLTEAASLEEAKSACQADFERRVRGCVEEER